jgi:8-oxo-dGTP pyrophosphatase MutT (NUDIX family)/2'-5' RNA ligase
MIAHTEIARAVSSATMDRFTAMGVTTKVWLIAPARACPACVRNSKQGAIPLADNFDSGSPSPPGHPSCWCALGPGAVGGVDLSEFTGGKSARLADRSVRVIDLNGQETRRDRRQDDTGGYAGGGAANVRPHYGDGTQMDIPGGVPGSQAGGEPPRWDGSEPEPRVLTAPDDEDDADYPGERGVPSRPGTYWPAPYMDGYWPQGGIGTQQAGTSSPGGGGPRGRPPNGVGKGAAITGAPVDASVVERLMLENFPPQAIAWVKDAAWVLADVPQSMIDRDDEQSWAASRQPERVAHFARQYREDPASVKPAVAVLEPGEDKVKIIDGHHRDEGAALAGKPLRAFVGRVSSHDGPWDETHSYQAHQGADPANKTATGADDPTRVAFLLIRARNGEGKWRYLLQKRDDETWGLPGGKCHEGELPWAAAVREASEELGDLPPVKASAVWSRPEEEHVVWTWLVTLPSPFTPSADGATSGETAGWGWFKRGDVGDLPLHPAMRETWDALDFDAPNLGGEAPGVSKAATPGLTSRSGMISLDLPPGTVRPVPGGLADHHVTVVYLGSDLDDEAFAEACTRAEAAARLVPGPLVGILAGVDSFPPSTGSDGKVPVFIPARIPLAERLRDALADLSASEHAQWSPHVTLRYQKIGEPLPDPGPPVPVTFTHLAVHRGDEVRQFPLGG